jgi:hypothetical protein
MSNRPAASTASRSSSTSIVADPLCGPSRSPRLPSLMSSFVPADRCRPGGQRYFEPGRPLLSLTSSRRRRSARHERATPTSCGQPMRERPRRAPRTEPRQARARRPVFSSRCDEVPLVADVRVLLGGCLQSASALPDLPRVDSAVAAPTRRKFDSGPVAASHSTHASVDYSWVEPPAPVCDDLAKCLVQPKRGSVGAM